jgi:hypothetical protein
MKYLIILIGLVLLKYLVVREGLYSKTVSSVGYMPNLNNVTDKGITKATLLYHANLVNEDILNNQKSAIYLNNITLFS